MAQEDALPSAAEVGEALHTGKQFPGPRDFMRKSNRNYRPAAALSVSSLG